MLLLSLLLVRGSETKSNPQFLGSKPQVRHSIRVEFSTRDWEDNCRRFLFRATRDPPQAGANSWIDCTPFSWENMGAIDSGRLETSKSKGSGPSRGIVELKRNGDVTSILQQVKGADRIGGAGLESCLGLHKGRGVWFRLREFATL